MKKRLFVFALMLVLSMQFAFAATTSFDVVTLGKKSITATFYDSEDSSLQGFETYDDDTGDGIFSFEIESEDVSKFDIRANVDGPHMDNIILNKDGYETGKCYKLELFQDTKNLSEKPCPGENNESSTEKTNNESESNEAQTNETQNNETSQTQQTNGSKETQEEQTSTQKDKSQNQGSFLSGFLTSGSNGNSNSSFFKTAFYVIAGILVLWIILFIFRTVLKKREDKDSDKPKKVKVTKLSDLKSKLEEDRQKVSENKKTLNESIKEAEESIEKAQEAIYNLRKQQEGKSDDSDSKSKDKKSSKKDD